VTYNPWWDAQERYPHIHIEWLPIAPYHAMLVTHDDVIFVDENITRAERRCALAHEIAHMDTGDRSTDLCWFSARQETAADQLAARRLIDVGHLAAVLRWCTDPREVAAELEVTLNVLALRTQHMHPAERGLIKNAMSRRESVA
jgi:Zn-dependent peptidase ImmA (M78 family)